MRPAAPLVSHRGRDRDLADQQHHQSGPQHPPRPQPVQPAPHERSEQRHGGRHREQHHASHRDGERPADQVQRNRQQCRAQAEHLGKARQATAHEPRFGHQPHVDKWIFHPRAVPGEPHQRHGPDADRGDATQVGTSGCEIIASPSIISAEPTVNATAPATSNGSFTPRYRGTWRIVPTKPASATGTSGTNTHRHPQTSATMPPIVGPTACPIPFTDAHAPIARLRRWPENIQVINPITAGANAAAATPPSVRHAINSGSDGAVAEPMAHTAVANKAAAYARRRPKRSPNHPASGTVAAKATRKPTTTNTPLPRGASNSSRIASSGMLTTLLLTVPTRVPANSAASPSGVPAS